MKIHDNYLAEKDFLIHLVLSVFQKTHITFTEHRILLYYAGLILLCEVLKLSFIWSIVIVLIILALTSTMKIWTD